MQKIFLLLLIVSLYGVASGQTGTPDPSFGNNGYISTPAISSGHSSQQNIKECILHPDGKMSMVVQASGKTIISKRLSNGLADTGYGKDGFSMAVSLIVSSAAIQQDGKIVVAGTTNGSADFMLARYNADGTTDATFGNGGTVIYNAGSTIDFLNAMIIAPGGRIITAGSSQVNGIDHFIIVCFTPDGAPDNSFGNNAVTITDFDGMSSSISSIRLQPDGKIIAAGTVNSPSYGDFALARYNADGSPDLSFHATGRTSSDFGSIDRATSLLLDNTGKIYAGGNSFDLSGFEHFRIARYNPDGEPDLTYNAGAGSVSPVFGDSYDILTNIRQIADGSIIASGHSNINMVNNDVAVMHILTGGTVDKEFGNNGLLLADYNNGYDESDFLVIQPDGKILTGGLTAGNSQPLDTWFSCFRFNGNGTPDLDFGNAGVMLDFLPGSYYAYTALFEQPDAKLMASIESSDGTNNRLFLSRFNKTGTPDSSYGANGIKELNYEYGTSFFQPDGKLIRIGYSPTNNGDFMLLRYNTDGSPDAGFGNGGKVTSDFGGNEGAGAIAFQADGKIIVGGSSRDASGSDWLIVRYNTDGSIDGSFGTAGYLRKNIMTEENIQSISIASDGKIILGGTGYIYPPDFSYIHFDVLITRLNPDGSFDTGFGDQGIVIIDRSNNDYLGSLAVQADNKIVFTYSMWDGISREVAFLERLHVDGTGDTGFGENGKTPCDGNWMKLQADQKILVTGTRLNDHNNYDFTLARYTKDGAVDIPFGNNGKTMASFAALDNTLYTNLIAGTSLFSGGSGIDQWGHAVGLIAKFRLESANISCPGNLVVTTDKNSCSAKVINIDPMPGCGPGIDINYKLTGATSGIGTCSASEKIFNKGVTMVTYNLASDTIKSCSFAVTVLDKELPAIENLSAGPSTLWSADHKMKDVVLNYSVSDNCGINNTQIFVSSNEPVINNGGVPGPDWQIIDPHHIRLRAERLRSGNGRTYTIKVVTTDVDGNEATKTTLVNVPKRSGSNCRMDIQASPNPSHNYFLLTIQSSCDDQINARVFNCNGVLMTCIHNINAHAPVRIGERFLPGIYFFEARQSGTVKTIKLIKQ